MFKRTFIGGLVSLSLLAVSNTAQAAGDVLYRRVKGNSLFQCDGKVYEIYYEYGNQYGGSVDLTILCLTAENRARWILSARDACRLKPIPWLPPEKQPEPCQGRRVRNIAFKDSYGWSRTYKKITASRVPLRHFYVIQKAVLGEFCDYLLDGSWFCDRVENLTRKSFQTWANESFLGLSGDSPDGGLAYQFAFTEIRRRDERP